MIQSFGTSQDRTTPSRRPSRAAVSTITLNYYLCGPQSPPAETAVFPCAGADFCLGGKFLFSSRSCHNFITSYLYTSINKDSCPQIGAVSLTCVPGSHSYLAPGDGTTREGCPSSLSGITAYVCCPKNSSVQIGNKSMGRGPARRKPGFSHFLREIRPSGSN